MKRYPRVIALSLGLCCLLSSPVALTVHGSPEIDPPYNNAGIATRIHQVLVDATISGNLSGAVVVMRRGAVLARQGFAPVKSQGSSTISTQTEFPLPGQSFTFAGAAVLRLELRGKVAPTHRVCAYLASCPRMWQSVTIAKLLHRIARSSISPELRATMSVVEQASGMPYATYVGRELFRPRHMTRASVDPTGTVQTSADDLNRWYSAMLGCSVVVSLEELNAALAPSSRLITIVHGRQMVKVEASNSHAAIGVRMFPAQNTGVIVLANHGPVGPLLDAIQRVLLPS